MNVGHLPTEAVTVQAARAQLNGDLTIPEGAQGIVIFAHGSGSGRKSSRNRMVAELLHDADLATLLFDLLTADEERIDRRTAEYRFDIPRLGERLTGAVDWTTNYHPTAALPIGLFGASTGAAAALISAAERPEQVQAVVSRGGRPDLAGDALPMVRAPTLLLVGGYDDEVIDLNRDAAARLHAEHRLVIIPGASHLFEEPGKLEEVAHLSGEWFRQHLKAR